MDRRSLLASTSALLSSGCLRTFEGSATTSDGGLEPSGGTSNDGTTGEGTSSPSPDEPVGDPLSTDWPTYQADPRNTGRVTATIGPTGSLTEAWSVSRGDSPPAVADGIVYVFDHEGLVALDGSDGTERWTVSGDFRGAPTVANGRVLVPERQGPVRAFEVESGAEAWTFDDFTADTQWVTAPITVADGRAFFGVIVTGVGSYHCYGVDVETGSKVWQTPSDKVFGAPAVSEEGVFVVDYGGNLVSLAPANGTERWATRVDAIDTQTAPAVNGDAVVTAGRRVRAFDTGSGEERWASGELINTRTTPTIAETYVYAVGSRGFVYAIDRSNGDIAWKEAVGNDRLDASPALTRDTLYVPTPDGVYGLDPKTGEERFSYDVRVGREMAVVDGYLFVLTGGLMALAEAGDS